MPVVVDEGARIAGRELTERFERDAREVGRARRFVRSSLWQWGLEGQVTPLELAVSELVSNALLHGEGTIEVRLAETDRQVLLEVTDEGHASQPPRPRTSTGYDGQPGGLGLHLIGQLADRWGATSGDDCTRVWLVRHTDER